MTDAIMDQIKAAQAAPAELYMVWADVGGDQVVLHSLQMPSSIGSDAILSRTRALAEKTLADCGYSTSEVKAATLHVTALPTAEETAAELDAQAGPDVELVLVDLALWEAARHRLHLSPYAVGNDHEMDYKGLKIRRSVVA